MFPIRKHVIIIVGGVKKLRNSKEVAKYIGELLKEKNIKPAQYAKKIGVDRSTISRYLNGTRKISMDDLPKLAEGLGVTSEELLIKDEELKAVDNLYLVNPNHVNIPLIGEIACGEPILAKENITDYIAETKELLPKGDLFYLEAKGNSMYPTIPDGSLVLIREQPEVENREIAAVLLNDDNEASLKRVNRQGNQLLLVSDNTEYSPIIVNDDNPAKIIGKAMSVRTNL